jgi:hypothetical protein
MGYGHCFPLAQGHSDNAGLDPVFVEKVQDIKAANSFANLVLPQDLKRTIKALTASYAKDPLKTSLVSPDLIPGKGEGKIILLHG